MTQYFLHERYIGGACVEISSERCDALCSASREISCIRDIEECFSVLAGAFVTFEKHLLEASIDYFYHRNLPPDVDQFFDNVRQEINLNLISFLTASRVYEEQTHRRLSELSILTGEEYSATAKFSEQFDARLEYRVMYALRNHALHNRLPIDAFSFGGRNLRQDNSDHGSPSRLRITLDPKIIVSEFCASDKIKKDTQNQVAELGFDYLDLKIFLRIFQECLFKIHAGVRDLLDGVLEDALAMIKEASHEVEAQKGKEVKLLHILAKNGAAEREWINIDYSVKSRVLEARKFWNGFRAAGRAYVSSEVIRGNDTYPGSHKKIWVPE